MEKNSWTEEQIKKGKTRFIHTAQHIMPEFVIDERNREIINDLFFYFHKIEGGRLDQDKGLWLEGPVGTGKSSLMNIFSQYLRAYRDGSAFKIYNCTTIANEYSHKDKVETNANPDALDKYTYNRSGYRPFVRVPMCFDELGREPIPAIHYGQRLNVMEYILHIRYTYWQSEKLLTYVTTNLKASQVETMYNDYIRDRRAEMFNIIAMPGESRRK